MLEALEPRVHLSGWTYVVGQTFTGTAHHEALELLGKRRVVYAYDTFQYGTTCCRVNRCADLSFWRCTFAYPSGPADPDGSGLQLIDCSRVSVSHCDFSASAFASDLLSVYGDAPVDGGTTVDLCRFVGRGLADFSTSLCIDGKYPPVTHVSRCSIFNARCGITEAAGRFNTYTEITYTNCQTDFYRFRPYQ